MKVHHLAVAAMLLGTGWSTNVVYEYQTGQSLWRGVASEEVVQITIDNLEEQFEKLVELKEATKEKQADIDTKIAKEDVNLEQIIELRDVDSKDLNTKNDAFNGQADRIRAFIEGLEGQVAQSSQERFDEIMAEDVLTSSHITLYQAIEKKLEEKTLAQQKVLDELSTGICEQNRQLSSLTSKIEELLEDKKKVVDAADDEEEEEEEATEEDEQAKLERQIALMSAFSSNFVMPPSTFFNTQQPIGLASESNPLGVDVNFMMMANMLTGSNGFGPRASINYAPVYNQQRTYYGMPSLTNYSGDAILGNTLLEGQSNTGLNPGYLRAIQGNLNAENGPIFTRGNGLQGAFQF